MGRDREEDASYLVVEGKIDRVNREEKREEGWGGRRGKFLNLTD